MDTSGWSHVVWMSQSMYTGCWDIAYQLLDNYGGVRKTLFVSSDASNQPAMYPNLDLDIDSDPLMVWVDSAYGTWEIFYRKFDVFEDSLPVAVDSGPIVVVSDLDGHHSGRVVGPFSEVDIPTQELKLEIEALHAGDPGSSISYGGPPLFPPPTVHIQHIHIPGRVKTKFLESPGIAVDGYNEVHIVWSDFRDGHWQVYYQQQTNPADVHAIPQVLIDDLNVSNTDADAISPAICVDKFGSIHIVWQDYRSGHAEIWWQMRDGYTLLAEACVSGGSDGFDSAGPDVGCDQGSSENPNLFGVHTPMRT